MELLDKLKKTASDFQGKKVIIAYSGGKDSTLVLLLAIKFARSVLPVFFDGPIIFPVHEKDLVKRVCNSLNLEFKIMVMNPLDNEDFRKNPENRCYVCKSQIMKHLQNVKAELKFDVIAEGTNISEMSGHRPGYLALQENGILSPLLSIGVTKAEIVKSIMLISQKLEDWFGENINVNKLKELLIYISESPSNPCLSSRIEYNLPISLERLEMVSKAEEWLKSEFGLETLRVRLHSNGIARVEVLKDKIPMLTKPINSEKITNYLENLGFCYITLDLKGFRSGSLIENQNKT